MPARLGPASVLSLAERASLFNAGYEDYVMPFRVDEAIVRGMTEWFDIDLDASRVAFREDTPVGFANLAVRGDEAWIGGIGVVAPARRQGLGEQLMRAVHQEARARGVTRVWLEVIERNERAYLLYRKLGYEVVREVEVWTLSAEVAAGSAREVPVEQAHARIRAARHGREPWQRADGTLAYYADAVGLETERGAAVFRAAGTVQLVQIAGDDANELLRTIRTRGTVHALNVPVGDPAADALRELGATVAVRQREMMLAFSSEPDPETGCGPAPEADLGARLGPPMALRICLVTPFAWSQPHDVNEHVAGVAQELRALGHAVTIVASSNRAADLSAGRHALLDGSLEEGELLVVGPALPISRRSRVGVPVGVRANLSRALRAGRFDVVHGFEPALPSLSYLALREAESLAVATFLSPERLAYPPGRSQRERLLGRIDVLLATSEETASAAAVRFPGDYRIISEGVDTSLFEPAEKRNVIAFAWRQTERPLLRAVLHVLGELPDWSLTLLRTKPLTTRPYIPRTLIDRVEVRAARDGPSRAAVLGEAAIFVPATHGLTRLALEAAAAGAAVAAPPGVRDQPQLAAAEMGRLADDDDYRTRRALSGRAAAERQTFADVAHELEEIYESLRGRRRSAKRDGDPLADRDWIVVDLHMHTSASHDCRVAPALLLEHTESEGLGAIAVTDHNVFSGAQEVAALARGRDIVVILGEEVKTDGQGEVIGLFLEEAIPRGLSFGDTIAAIKEQGGVVYVPHPFDRMHTIPDPATLHRHLADIDVFEVYNARLLFETYNDEALRFARKYNLTMGAGSDAHVLQGVGTGALRMRAFDGRDEFLLSLRTAEILRRPKSLLYLQSLKWAAQAKERVR